MTQELKIEATIRLVFLMVGIFLMLYGGLDERHFWMVPLGAIIILLVPVKFYRSFENRIYENPKTDMGVWRLLSQGQLDELITMIEPKEYMHVGGSKGHNSMGIGLFMVFFLSIWSSGMIAPVSTTLHLPVTLPAAIIFTIFTWFRLRSFSSIVPHPLAIQMTALQIFNKLQLPSQFTKKYEAQIVDDVNGDPDILNIRLDARPKDPISGLLCLRLNLDRTKVQTKTYSFPYLVLVFGGDGAFYSERLNKEINQAVCGIFHIEKSLTDGNSVFVILPSADRYTLDATGDYQLANIMSNLCEVCANNRSIIESVSRMPKS